MSQPKTFESSDDESLAALGIEIGDRIGRYVVLSQLGVGAMGMVLAAYDPELQRKAALKLLKRRAEDRPKARMRLRREAQALAKLHHPNVVGVYDVGVHEQQVFIAMEFVQGRSLSDWMKPVRDKVRPWREVLSVFMAAGRGLLAVHEAGLVHRDFKPDNVMIGDDERVLVADFGLARLNSESEHDEEEIAVDSDSKVLLTKITKTGASLGTPAYMAPEQFQRHPATVHSDQFSFCVALSEALHGVLPQASIAREGSMGASSSGRASVPAWLDRVVSRGLSPDPRQRFASMAELLDALVAGEARRRRFGALAAVAVVGFAVAGGIGVERWESAAREDECRAAGDAVDRVWNRNTRAALIEGVVATEVAYAPTVVEKLMPWLDGQAETWREHARLACRNAKIDERWDAATHDKATWCLEQHRLELELLVSELSAADAGIVEEAVLVAAGMSLVATCTDEASLATLPDPPAVELRPAVADLRRELMRASILERAGEYEVALAVVREALVDAEALGWIPMTAALRARESSLLRETGAYKEAEVAGEAAYMEAALSGTWDIAAIAATKQAVIVGLHGHRPDAGKAWATNDAVVAIAHAGDPFGLREASRLNNLAAIHWGAGEHEDAARLYEQVVQMRESALGPEHPEVAAALQNLGAAQRALGKYQKARALYEHALDIYEQTLGPQHPQVAMSLGNLGNVQAMLGDDEQARASYERALAIQREVLGPEHLKIATMLLNLSNTYSSLREPLPKEALIRQALAIYERAGKADDPTAALARINLGGLLTSLERYEEAEVLLEQARASLERSKGAEHPNVASSLNAIGKLYHARGEHERALEIHERALAIREKAFGPEHPDVADSRYYMGLAHESLGHLDLARELLERALAIREASDSDPVELADARFALARVLPENERMRARVLVELALAHYVVDDDSTEEMRKAHDWASAHPERAHQPVEREASPHGGRRPSTGGFHGREAKSR